MRITEIKKTRYHDDVLPKTEDLEEGKVYISEKYGVSKHLCFCGCGELVVLILDRWKHSYDFGVLTVDPSVGSFNLPCKSHYIIRANKVEWC